MGLSSGSIYFKALWIFTSTLVICDALRTVQPQFAAIGVLFDGSLRKHSVSDKSRYKNTADTNPILTQDSMEQPIFQPTPLQGSQEESRNAGSRAALRGSLLTFWILLVSLLQFCSPQTQPKPGPPRLTKAHELMCARARPTPARTHFHFC